MQTRRQAGRQTGFHIPFLLLSAAATGTVSDTDTCTNKSTRARTADERVTFRQRHRCSRRCGHRQRQTDRHGWMHACRQTDTRVYRQTPHLPRPPCASTCLYFCRRIFQVTSDAVPRAPATRSSPVTHECTHSASSLARPCFPTPLPVTPCPLSPPPQPPPPRSPPQPRNVDEERCRCGRHLYGRRQFPLLQPAGPCARALGHARLALCDRCLACTRVPPAVQHAASRRRPRWQDFRRRRRQMCKHKRLRGLQGAQL